MLRLRPAINPQVLAPTVRPAVLGPARAARALRLWPRACPARDLHEGEPARVCARRQVLRHRSAVGTCVSQRLEIYMECPARGDALSWCNGCARTSSRGSCQPLSAGSRRFASFEIALVCDVGWIYRKRWSLVDCPETEEYGAQNEHVSNPWLVAKRSGVQNSPTIQIYADHFNG